MTKSVSFKIEKAKNGFIITVKKRIVSKDVYVADNHEKALQIIEKILEESVGV